MGSQAIGWACVCSEAYCMQAGWEVTTVVCHNLGRHSHNICSIGWILLMCFLRCLIVPPFPHYGPTGVSYSSACVSSANRAILLLDVRSFLEQGGLQLHICVPAKSFVCKPGRGQQRWRSKLEAMFPPLVHALTSYCPSCAAVLFRVGDMSTWYFCCNTSMCVLLLWLLKYIVFVIFAGFQHCSLHVKCILQSFLYNPSCHQQLLFQWKIKREGATFWSNIFIVLAFISSQCNHVMRSVLFYACRIPFAKFFLFAFLSPAIDIPARVKNGRGWRQ